MKHAVSLRPYEISLGALYGSLQFFVMPSLAVLANTYIHLPQWGLQFALFSLNFLCSLIIYHRFLRDSWDEALEQPGKVLLSAVWGLLLYYGTSVLVNYLVFALCPDFLNLNNAGIAELTRGNPVLMFVAIVFFAPVAEELLFRGLLFRNMLRFGKVTGWLCSVLAFALVHVLGYIGEYDLLRLMLATLQYIPAGIALCYAYHRSGSFLAPVVMHIFINFLAFIAI